MKTYRYSLHIIFFLLLILTLSVFIYDDISLFFAANPILNGVIIGTFLIGITLVFRQIHYLKRDTEWLKQQPIGNEPLTYKNAISAKSLIFLKPLALYLDEDKQNQPHMPHNSLLDIVRSKLDESRDLFRYIIGLLVFLGLLGTFWGLLLTINSISDVISGLSASSSNFADIFDSLKKGLEAPISGMGTAFSSSLFGLSGSLVLGYVELQSYRAQNEFFNLVEEWLARVPEKTRRNISSQDLQQSSPEYTMALLEKTAENMDKLENITSRLEQDRISLDSELRQMIQIINKISSYLEKNMKLISTSIDEKADLQSSLKKLNNHLVQSSAFEKESGYNESLEKAIEHIVSEMEKGREKSIHDLRSDIKLLAKTISAKS